MQRAYRSLFLFFIFYVLANGFDSKWVAVGSLHNWYSSVGCELEVGRTGQVSEQLDGRRFPAQDDFQDSQASKALWIGSSNYADPLAGITYPYKVVSIGPRGPVDPVAVLPVEFTSYSRFATPQVFVDGQNASLDVHIDNTPDFIDPDLPADNMLVNTIHTSIGVSMTRKIYAFSHPQHDNYMITDYVFKNTGIITGSGTVETQTLTDLMFSWIYRNAVNREGAAWGSGDYWMPQNAGWGRNTMNEVIGEGSFPDDPFRAYYSWHGLHSQSINGHNNIGGPYYGTNGDGHLSARQFVGGVTLHADTSPNDQTDALAQPSTTWFLGSDSEITYNIDQFNPVKMQAQYEHMSSGHPPLSHAEEVGSGFADAWGNDPGGYSQTQGYGPYTLAPGDSIHLVFAEGAAGLSRGLAYSIGGNWLYGSAPYILPDGSTAANADEYKNAWVFTGVDSLMQTFQRALETFNSDYDIPLAPPPPESFQVFSSGVRVDLAWDDNAASYPGFAGYRLFRCAGDQFGFYEEIFACGINTAHSAIVNSYEDSDVNIGENYYYYIVSFDDGNTNGGIPLYSSEFLTRTSVPATISGRVLVDADLYVNPTGSDDNSGLTAGEPLQTIQAAKNRILHNVLHPHTIHLAVGIYSLSNSNEHYPITIDNYLTIQGVGSLLTILDPEGGSRGISVSGDSVRISGLTIRNSKAPFYPDDKGGGLSVNNASLTLNDVVLTGNQASSGGGIYATNSKLIFKGVSIHDNQASRRGGGIYLYQDCQLEFYATDLSNIYSNQAVISGNDLATNFSFLGGSTYAFSVDTFTVADPSDYFAYPSGSFAVSSVNNVFPQYDADLYVSPAGDDGNTGLTSIEPLKTITHALKSIISSSENQHTIHLAEGTYSSSSNEERFPLYLRDGLSMTGQSSENTNLDGEQLTSLIRIYDHSDVSINDLSLKRATDRAIYSYYSSLELNDLLIEKNNADRGAGIYLLGTNLSLSGVTIRYNSGGGLYLGSSTHVVFDPVKRCNIYLNETGDGIGQDIASYQFNEVVNVILDTCTQKYPTLETAAPLEKFSFDILNGIVPQIAHDIYVSPEGNNENSGTSSEDPLQTLSLALDLIYANAENPRKIYLADGVYSPTLTNEIFPLVGKNNVSITGESVENTILDGDSLSRLIALDEISEFKVESLTIRNGYESRGGAISCINSAPVFQSILFLQNRSVVAAGVLEQQESSPVFINCSFVANSSDAGATGVTVFNSPSYPVFINSLVWENGLIPIYAGAGQIILVNTLIERGEASVLGFSQWFGQTIDADPQFVGGEPFSYHLSSSSPGINAGTAFFELDGDTLLNLTIDDFTGDAPDIGALESPYLVSVRPEIQTPYEYSLYQNHPNPFNPSTTISYEIPSASEVTIKIFDLRGREVWSSTENHLNSGKYSFTWWGQDSRGLALGSGVFVVQMRTREYMATRKILLLK